MTNRVENLKHVKSVEVRIPPNGVVWNFEGVNSGIDLKTLPWLTSRQSLANSRCVTLKCDVNYNQTFK
ncbi:hypothetical protein TNCV_3168911 [Trichonephila clavipes]|nr:hypothetical protein TNCV_3168911 [Trichonephila clavipes]